MLWDNTCYVLSKLLTRYQVYGLWISVLERNVFYTLNEDNIMAEHIITPLCMYQLNVHVPRINIAQQIFMKISLASLVVFVIAP